MIKKCIKVPFVEEVTGKPGAMVRFVEQSTSSLDTTVQAAVDGLYCLGNAQLVKNTFLGLFRSMVAGVMRDGKPRKIADFIRAYPVFTGAVDLDKGFDPKENGVYLAVELLNEMKLDISGWSFEDVTEGRKAITIESVKGIDFGVVDPTQSVEINGRGLSGSHKVELQLEGGEVIAVAPEYVSGDIARMDIAAAALAQFMDPANDGKALAITVRGNFAKATKTVKLTCQRILAPKMKKVVMEGYESSPDVMKFSQSTPVTIEGENLKLKEGDKLDLELWEEGHSVETGNLLTKVTSSTADKIELSCLQIDNQMCPDGQYWNADTRIVLTRDGVREEHHVTFHE